MVSEQVVLIMYFTQLTIASIVKFLLEMIRRFESSTCCGATLNSKDQTKEEEEEDINKY